MGREEVVQGLEDNPASATSGMPLCSLRRGNTGESSGFFHTPGTEVLDLTLVGDGTDSLICCAANFLILRSPSGSSSHPTRLALHAALSSSVVYGLAYCLTWQLGNLTIRSQSPFSVAHVYERASRAGSTIVSQTAAAVEEEHIHHDGPMDARSLSRISWAWSLFTMAYSVIPPRRRRMKTKALPSVLLRSAMVSI